MPSPVCSGIAGNNERFTRVFINMVHTVCVVEMEGIECSAKDLLFILTLIKFLSFELLLYKYFSHCVSKSDSLGLYPWET